MIVSSTLSSQEKIIDYHPRTKFGARLYVYRCVSVHGGIWSRGSAWSRGDPGPRRVPGPRRGAWSGPGGVWSGPDGGAWSWGFLVPACLAGFQAHTQGGSLGGSAGGSSGPHPRGKLRGICSRPTLNGKLRGIWSRPTPKGEVEGI